MMPETIATPRLLLRPAMVEDAAALHRLMTWEVVRWLSRPPWPLMREDVEAHLRDVERQRRDGTGAVYVVTFDGEVTGAVGLTERDGARNLGYWLGEAFRDRGFMSEAAAAIIDAYFDADPAIHLTSGFFRGNHASARIQAKLGFVVVGESLRPSRPMQHRLPHRDTVLGRARWQGTGIAA